MSVSGVSSTSSSAGTSLDRSTIAGNFDTFLQLLTTQLRNQNPMDPLDTNQFTQQLVQYSQVEQQLKTNDFLASLVAGNSYAAQSSAVAYIGKEVTSSGVRSELSNGKASWAFSLPADATVTATIKDENGNVVYTEKGNMKAGDGQFVWDGTTSTGAKKTSGTYTISMQATDSTGKVVSITTATSGTVTGVDFTGSEPVLLLGNTRVNLSSVTKVVAGS